jgi:hypothetical protein
MKHARGIHLGRPDRYSTAYLGQVTEPVSTTFGDIAEYHALGGHCPRCERVGWVDKYELMRRFSNAYLGSLAVRLRCLGCGNRQGNKWVLGQLPR